MSAALPRWKGSERGGGRRKRRQQLEREHTLLRKGNKIVFVLFAVRNDPMEKQRLMVQSDEKNDKVLGSVSLTPVKSSRAREGADLESHHQKKEQGKWIKQGT